MDPLLLWLNPKLITVNGKPLNFLIEIKLKIKKESQLLNENTKK